MAEIKPTPGEVEALKTPVEELYVSSPWAEREVEAILLLNVDQSAEERYPFCPEVDCCMEKIPVAESYERGEVAEREEGWRSQTPRMA